MAAKAGLEIVLIDRIPAASAGASQSAPAPHRQITETQPFNPPPVTEKQARSMAGGPDSASAIMMRAAEKIDHAAEAAKPTPSEKVEGERPPRWKGTPKRRESEIQEDREPAGKPLPKARAIDQRREPQPEPPEPSRQPPGRERPRTRPAEHESASEQGQRVIEAREDRPRWIGGPKKPKPEPREFSDEMPPDEPEKAGKPIPAEKPKAKRKESSYVPPDNAAEWDVPEFREKYEPAGKPMSKQRGASAGGGEESAGKAGEKVRHEAAEAGKGKVKAPTPAAEAAGKEAGKAAATEGGKAAAAKAGGWMEKAGVAMTEAKAGVSAGAAGSASGAAAGVMRLAAAAGPAAVAVGGLGLAAGIAVSHVKNFASIMNEQVERLQGMSGAVATAVANNQVKSILQDLNRAQRVGPQLARFEDTRGKFEQVQHEAWTAILEILLKMYDLFEPVTKAVLGAAESATDTLSKNTETVYQIWSWLATLGNLPMLILKVIEWFSGEEDEKKEEEDVMFREMIVNHLRGHRAAVAPMAAPAAAAWAAGPLPAF